MSGGKLLLDTNVILYYLGGDLLLRDLMDGQELYLSTISVIELLGYPGLTEAEQARIGVFLEDCHELPITPEVRDRCISIRRAHNLKIPDSLIAATALQADMPLVSADGVFERVEQLHWIHYQLS
jgi:hypothetical protein